MTFWMEIWAGCIASVLAGCFFVCWYVVFQRFLQATDVVIGYGWTEDIAGYHLSFDIRNFSKSRTYQLANIAYRKQGEETPLWVDNKSLWGAELKPGSINFFRDVAPVKAITAQEMCLQTQVYVRVQAGREFPAAGPGQDRKQVMGWFQWAAFRLRQFTEKKAIPLE